MLNQTQKNFNKIKEMLLHQQKKVEADIKAVDQDDPVNDIEGLAESSEPGTDSWLADVHGRAMAVKGNLQDMLNKTRKALANIKSGKYGKCDQCGKMIEAERLKAMPTATLCISCSKKASGRK